MKRVLRNLRKRLTRSEVDQRVDRLRTESRAENARKIAAGEGRAGLRENAALLGLDIKTGQRPKMVFGRDK